MVNNCGGSLLRQVGSAVRGRSTSAGAAAAGGSTVREVTLYRRLSALGAAPEGTVAKTINQWLREGRRLGGLHAVILARKLRKYGRFKHALEIMEWMDARGMKMWYRDYALRLELVSKVEGIASAEKYFSRLSTSAKNSDTYQALLSCYCTTKMKDEAIALFEKMKQLNYASSNFVYNNMMTLHMKLEQPEKVPALLQQMTAEKVAPDMITYSLVLNSYASLGDVEAVEQLIEVLKGQDADMLKWPLYGTLASFYISTGLVEKAESALKMLEKSMDVWNEECYRYLISLYSKTGNLVEANRVWNDLKAFFPKTLNKSYFTILSALDRLDDIDALKRCFEEWESNCSTYDIRLASLVVKAYLRRDMIRDAEYVLEDAIHKCPESDFYIFQIFIDYFLEKQRTDLALKFVEDAVLKVKNQVWKPSKSKVDSFLRYLQHRQNMHGADVFLDGLKKLDFQDLDANGVLPPKPAAAYSMPSLHQLFKQG
uniref:Pentatricopeptide repeat-containing protein At4g01990, mitochondrial n=1 Tax=Anthurium amnicola TaxID=1678845 RepID=A0A1D1YZY6_9ARAE